MFTLASKIFVAGDRGLIGSALLRVFWSNGCQNVVTATRSELDLRDGSSVQKFLAHHESEIIVLGAGRVE